MSKLHSSEVASFLVKDIEYLNKKYAYLQNSSSSPTSIARQFSPPPEYSTLENSEFIEKNDRLFSTKSRSSLRQLHQNINKIDSNAIECDQYYDDQKKCWVQYDQQTDTVSLTENENSSSEIDDDWMPTDSNNDINYFDDEHRCWMKETDKILILAHKGMKDLEKKMHLSNLHKILGIKIQAIALMMPADKKSGKDSKYCVSYLEQYSSDIDFYQEIGSLRENFPFTHIIPLNENDVLRAGIIRGKYKLNGMTEQECLLFRNKSMMIDLLEKAGLNVPESKDIKIILDLEDFKTQHKVIIVKPIAGVSGKNTWVIQDETSFRHMIRQSKFKQFFNSSSTGQYPVFIAQKFIDRPMFHVDGLFKEGLVLWSWPSIYSHPPLSLNHGKTVESHVLEDGPFAHYLNEYAKQVIRAMSADIHSSSVFHLEGFYRPELEGMSDFSKEKLFSKIIFCEIAARPGGFTIPQQLESAFGINLIIESIKLGSEIPYHIESPTAPLHLAYSIVIKHDDRTSPASIVVMEEDPIFKSIPNFQP